MADLVIYTAITGGKDRLHEPAHRLPGVEYVCFTDTPGLASKSYDIRPLPFAESTSRLTARRIKLFAHALFPHHAASLWLDASKRIRRDLSPLLAELQKADMACFAHPQRDCLYDEAQACARLGRDDADALSRQAAHYRAEGMPAHAGLYETSLLYRRHTQAGAALMEAWWHELCAHTARDQLSLPFVLREKQAALHALPYRRWHDPYLLQYPHTGHDPGDSRARMPARLHGAWWRLLQKLGLQNAWERAMQQVKHFCSRLFS